MQRRRQLASGGNGPDRGQRHPEENACLCTQHPAPEGSPVVTYKSRYDNWIGGEWVPPVKGQYFENPSPVTGKPFCEVARGTAEDIELALDAAHAAAPAWGRTSAAERAPTSSTRSPTGSRQNLELLAVAETWDNGKPVRETLAADLPLADRPLPLLRRRVRAPGGRRSREIDDDTVAYHFHEPLGVVGQIIPWNFPILMAVWKLAPALAAGNGVVLKPAEQTPASILLLIELIADLLPAGVLNIVNGFGVEAGKPLASQQPDPQDRLHRRDHHRPADHAVRQPEPDPGDAGARRQEPEHLLRGRRRRSDDDFYDKALEGFAMFALNQGEVCTCPSRALIQQSIYDQFLADGAPSGSRRSSRATRWTPTR